MAVRPGVLCPLLPAQGQMPGELGDRRHINDHFGIRAQSPSRELLRNKKNNMEKQVPVVYRPSGRCIARTLLVVKHASRSS